MRRTTHLILGAAAGTLVAASASIPVAAGAVWMGAVGGGFPDWLDLRSELRQSLRLRHRGASHGVVFVVVATAVIWFALRALTGGMEGAPEWTVIEVSTARFWAMAFGAGMLSHLLGDACTYAGIRPLLPLSSWKFWLVPRMLRSRSDGYLDRLALALGAGVIGFMVVRTIALKAGVI